jgi:hypothetical protein
MKDKTAVLLTIGAVIFTIVVGYFVFVTQKDAMDAYYEEYGVYPDLESYSPPVMTDLRLLSLIIGTIGIVLFIIYIFSNGGVGLQGDD